MYHNVTITSNNNGEYNIMSNESIEGNGSKKDAKTVTLDLGINFQGLPKETTSITLISSESLRLSSCKKLIVNYDRVHMAGIYGQKNKNLARNPDLVKIVSKYLHSFYSDVKDDSEAGESYQEWLERLAMSKTQLVLVNRAKNTALQAENTNVEKQVQNMTNLLEADKVDMDALDKMLALMQAKKAALMVQAQA
jgi:hypothetical protein